MIFNEADHTYTNNGVLYRGVTSTLKKFEPYTNWEEIAEKYSKKPAKKLIKDFAKKWGLSEEDIVKKFGDTFDKEKVLSIWKQAGERALIGGDYYHKQQEKEQAKLENVIYNPVVNNLKEAYDLKTLEPNKTYLELILYNNRARLSGQSDRTLLFDNCSQVRDYKTVNWDLTPEAKAYYDVNLKREVVKKYKRPFQRIPVTEYWKYALQLSTYGYMLELYGWPPTQGLFIDQVKSKYIPNNEVEEYHNVLYVDEIVQKTRVVTEEISVQVPYLKKEMIDFFNYLERNDN